jgi:septal ring factor EnvC (AmiA/AmiB activator)
MGRGRAVGLIAAAVLIVALVAAGARYFWIRHERQNIEQTVAELRRTAQQARTLLDEVTETRRTVDANLDLVAVNEARLRAQAGELHADLEQTRAGTTSAAVGAFLTATQANNLSKCLIGVSQALNQLSVGDNRAIDSLKAVDAPCRLAGAP